MKNLIYIFIASTLLLSCSIQKFTETAFAGSGIYETEVKILKNYKSSYKDVVFVGIRHLGDKKYYENIKKLIGNYQSQGYFVFYEGLTEKNTTDTIVFRKFRKILPIKFNMSDIYTLNYKTVLSNVISEKIPGFKFPENIIPQPQANLLITDKSKSKNIDVSFADFIKSYEKLFGNIKLDSCDFLDDWIGTECNSSPHKNRNKIFIDYRDTFLADYIITSGYQKIVVIYGEGHHKGVAKLLLKKGYKLVN